MIETLIVDAHISQDVRAVSFRPKACLQHEFELALCPATIGRAIRSPRRAEGRAKARPDNENRDLGAILFRKQEIDALLKRRICAQGKVLPKNRLQTETRSVNMLQLHQDLTSFFPLLGYIAWTGDENVKCIAGIIASAHIRNRVETRDMIANIPVLARIKNFRWGRPATMESFGAMSVCRVAVI